MKRTAILTLCLSLLLGLFSGCAAENTPYVPHGDALVYGDSDIAEQSSDEEAEPQEFSLAYYADRSLNPLTCKDYTNRVLFSLVYQGLFSVNRDYEAVPILCDRYEVSESYKTYTVYLADATFSDGTAITVEDVLASYSAAKESAYYGGRFTHIAEISGSGSAIIFTLDTAMESLPLLLDIPIVKASEVSSDQPLGSGPYILEKTVTGAQLRKNPDWWCSSPDLDATAEAIPLVACDSAAAIRDQFEFSDVGLVCADPCSDSYADFRCDYELWDCENGIFLYLGINVAYSDVFKDNASLRANLTYAIDRDKLVSENYRGFAQAATLPASPSSPYYSAGLASKYTYDPVRFVQAISSIKKPEEPVELLVNRDDSLRLRTARDIAEMLTECGLETVTVEKNSSDYMRFILAGNYDLYLGQTRLSANMDLSEFFRPWGEMSYNGLSDESLYVLCKDALENSGNYYNLHQAVANDGRVCPILFCSYSVYAERGLLTDLQPARDNVFYYTLGRTAEDALIPIDYDSNGNVATGVG
ncbi:MAG: hypothetical protein IJ375_00065 [Oscillospiraceae bacterium]|nr:hypothetical protein [Oscillospiraceae bacterium]